MMMMIDLLIILGIHVGFIMLTCEISRGQPWSSRCHFFILCVMTFDDATFMEDSLL